MRLRYVDIVGVLEEAQEFAINRILELANRETGVRPAPPSNTQTRGSIPVATPDTLAENDARCCRETV